MAATTNVEASQSPLKQVDRAAVEARLVRELDGGRAGLPILPHVAAQAIRFANDPKSDLRRLAELVEADPPIAARLLAVANSVIYTRAVRVSTTRAAIIRLGLEGTRDLLFQVVYASSTVGLPRYQDFVARSFRRSVLCGIAARAVSDKLRYRFEYDYLCGLLHDIGEARIYRILANFKEVIDPETLRDLVVRHHRRAGSDLAISWGLPEPIIETCARHHDDPAKASRLVKMVMMADLIVDIFEHRVVASPRAPAASEMGPAAQSGTHVEAEPVGAVATKTTEGEPDIGGVLAATSAVWPTSVADPPGAPGRKSAVFPTEGVSDHGPVAMPIRDTDSSNAAFAAILSSPVSPEAPDSVADIVTELDGEAREEALYARLEAMGVSKELADTVLAKLEESLGDLPL